MGWGLRCTCPDPRRLAISSAPSFPKSCWRASSWKLGRQQHLETHGETPPDAAALAAFCGDGIARNRPFIDGNKRNGLVAAELFLRLNGQVLRADGAPCVPTLLAVASGDISEETFALWMRKHSVARD